MAKAAEQPERFFNEAKASLAQLKGIPIVAIEALRTDEQQRDVVISIIRTCLKIAREAGLNVLEEIAKQDVRDAAADNLKDMMRDDRLISMEELKQKGLKLHFSTNGPVVVPA